MLSKFKFLHRLPFAKNFSVLDKLANTLLSLQMKDLETKPTLKEPDVEIEYINEKTYQKPRETKQQCKI